MQKATAMSASRLSWGIRNVAVASLDEPVGVPVGELTRTSFHQVRRSHDPGTHSLERWSWLTLVMLRDNVKGVLFLVDNVIRRRVGA